ncbi:hypothetical protein SDC9_149305 [bioreactor metagenome]|uniref:Uncharacterized protein n=1 Tax=bioreactor metagenome TaxID=1076179 RepID=A0A645ELE0_9ZZZZ
MENIIVILGTGVDLRDALNDFPQRYAAPKVPHCDILTLNLDLDFLSKPHDELIDCIIDDLFYENVTAIIIVSPVTNPPDVHAGTQPDVLQRRQGLDLALVVNVLIRFRHIPKRQIMGI